MSHTSEEETEWSDSELDECKNSSYEELKNGMMVKIADNLYQCPFCPGKRKRNYCYKDLLQHAYAIGKGSNRGVKQQGKHLGLVKFLEYDLGEGAPSHSELKVAEIPLGQDINESFVWPWVGIMANVPVTLANGKYVGQSGSKLKNELAREGFNPVRVLPLWNYRGHSGYAVVEFTKDWHGFSNALMLEKSYEANKKGRRDYYGGGCREDGLFGWIARADDYHSNGIIGKHLQKHGNLKTVSELEEEEKHKNQQLVSNLTGVIKDKDMLLEETEYKYNQTNMSLCRVIAQKDEMIRTHNAELQKMQQNARDHLESISKDHEKFSSQLEARTKELQQRAEELKWREVHNEHEERKVQMLKERNARATLEQKRADEEVLRLAEDQKRQKEQLHI